MVWNNREIVSKTPILTTFLLEGANIGQIVRMWTEWTAKGQSLTAWLMVNLALILWFNFYRLLCPEQKWARYCTGLGIVINSFVCLSVVYFRYIA